MLNAEVEVGHVSTAVCHAGNISYRVGRVASEQQQRAALGEDPLWHEMYDRLVAHLKANAIDVSTATLGPWLEVDQENECFRNHDAANQLVRGFYREPYVVPEIA